MTSHPDPCRRTSSSVTAGRPFWRRADDVLTPFKPIYSPQTEVLDLDNRPVAGPELNKVRAHGAAFDREESLAGFGCVAAAIGDPGEAVGAVSVCGPMNRMMFDPAPRLARPNGGVGNLASDPGGRWTKWHRRCQQMRPLRMGPTVRRFDMARSQKPDAVRVTRSRHPGSHRRTELRVPEGRGNDWGGSPSSHRRHAGGWPTTSKRWAASRIARWTDPQASPVRIYRPLASPLPVLVVFTAHGGGFRFLRSRQP